jgi:hypothetical protein
LPNLVKNLGLHPCPHEHPAKANNKLAEINVVRFISWFSLFTLLWRPVKVAHFPGQLYGAIPVVQAKSKNFSCSKKFS